MLEATWEAFEDATIDPRSVTGEPVGVFVGQWLSDFESRLFADTEQIDFHATTGSGRYASSGRVSFVLWDRRPQHHRRHGLLVVAGGGPPGLPEPSAGESSLAVAAGVNVILQPSISIAYSQSGMMAPDGHRSSATPTETVMRSEGVGVVLLKPLAAAVADGDPVRAVIRGSGEQRRAGQRAHGHPQPDRPGRHAAHGLRQRRSRPSGVGYIEAHGTGTRARPGRAGRPR